MTMTKSEALEIQGKQLEWYSRNMNAEQKAELLRRIADKTSTGPLNDGEAYPVTVINEFIPRGCDIEFEAANILSGMTRERYAAILATYD